MTTLGKYRHLSQCGSLDGHFTVLAIDHRMNLLNNLNRYATEPLDDVAFTDFKQLVFEHLLHYSTALLSDPLYGFGAGIANRNIGGNIGLLSPIEVTNYDVHPSEADVQFMPDWSVEKIKRIGGAGIKHLLYYHPEADTAGKKQTMVTRIVEQCNQHDIPYFLEPIVYSLDPEKSLNNDERRQALVETARTFSELGVDILKLQFPVDVSQEDSETIWKEACIEVDTACFVPWALLSAGVSYETFAKQARIACEAGASGVIVGRAVWAEAVALQGQERAEFLATTAVERMKALSTICRVYARPWFDRVSPPDISNGWMDRY